MRNTRGDPSAAPGVEVLIGYVVGPLDALASFSSIHATQVDLTGARQGVPLVPRETGTLYAIFESERRGRIGVELDYTGPQASESDPYLIRPSPGPGGNPITDVWAPLDGRTFNLGIRMEL